MGLWKAVLLKRIKGKNARIMKINGKEMYVTWSYVYAEYSDFGVTEKKTRKIDYIYTPEE